MLSSVIWILLGGFFAGQGARRLGAPALVGMVAAGILLGPQGGDVLSADILAAADALRTIAVMVILMKAGLGLDRDKLQQQSTVALRLGFLPATGEAIAVALLAMALFQFDWATGLLLGCIVGAESPAVIVPGMLRLKSWGWGVAKGIPDAILTGSALSDGVLLLVFSLLLTYLSQGTGDLWVLPGGLTLTPLQRLPLQVLSQVVLGVLVGWLLARLLVVLLAQQTWTENGVQDALVAASLALGLVVLASRVPIFSGYLGVMATGFFLIELDPPLARRLRQGFNALWVVAEILLFVLLGASINLSMLGEILGPGLVLLVVGTLGGRGLGWLLSTWGSNWTWRERLFLLPGNSAKATVQAAIGALPLALGLEGGEVILAIAALSILVTAPLGAWAIPTFAPRLLQRGAVDPTKGGIPRPVLLLAAVDGSPLATTVLTKAAELARRSNGQVVVLHVVRRQEEAELDHLRQEISRCLLDVRHRLITVTGAVPETIVQVAQDLAATEIVMGKGNHGGLSRVLLGSVSQMVLEISPIPVLVLARAEAMPVGESLAPKS